MLKVSIIIPVYNVESYIADCLNSVFSQDFNGSLECIVIDDGSTDKSFSNIKKILATYNGPINFLLFKNEKNAGLSHTRNRGIREASGEYVYFLDSDDIITPDCISSLTLFASKYPDTQIITGDFQTFPEKNLHKGISLVGKNFPEYSNDIAWIRSIFLTSFPVIACNKLIKKDFIQKNNLYFKEGIIHEDNHWHAMAYHHIERIAFVNKVTYYYRQRDNSITSSPKSKSNQFFNLSLIYQDIFSRNYTWDRPWARWIYDSLCHLYFSPFFFENKKVAKHELKMCVQALIYNSNCPLIIRIALFNLYISTNLYSFKVTSRLYRLAIKLI